MSDFYLAIPGVLRNEGGYVNDPADNGKETNFGISKRCLSPDTRVLTADLYWEQVGNLVSGQELLAFNEFPERRGKLNIRRFERSLVEKVGETVLPASRIVTTQRELIAGDDHSWLRRWGKHRVFDWCTTASLLWPKGRWTNGVNVSIASAFEPWTLIEGRDAGYLAAVLDGEGHIGGSDIAFSQKTGNALVQQTQECASRLGILLKKGNERHGVSTYHLVNRNKDPHYATKIAGSLGAKRLLHLLSDNLVGKNVASTYAKHETILDVEPLGNKTLIALSTSSRTVIAEGLLSHNSYPNVDIKSLTVEEATAIYLRDFWLFGGIIDQGVANKMLDSYVNMRHAAIKIAQRIAGVAVDGSYGPNTEAAINTMDPGFFLGKFRAALASYYQAIVANNPAEEKFLAGWLRRASQ